MNASQPWTAKRLFNDVFASLYPPEALARRSEIRALPVERCSEPAILARIDEIAEAFVHMAPPLLGIPSSALDGSDASVHRLGAALSRELRDELLTTATPDAPTVPLLATFVIHGALYVGRCAVKNHAGSWVACQPLWESMVRLDTALGACDLAPFSWWLKSLSDEEVQRLQLGPRYRQHVEIPCFDPTRLPVIPPPHAPIPRIAFPIRAQLFEHLEKHAPGIRGPGDDFPSEERFAEFKLEWVDFIWLGQGRLLLMHGPGQHGGAQLLWMSAEGFVKAAYYPADRAPTHIVQLNDPILRVVVSIDGAVRRHEMPWWGV